MYIYKINESYCIKKTGKVKGKTKIDLYWQFIIFILNNLIIILKFMNKLGKAFIGWLFSASITTTSFAQTWNNVNSIISDIEWSTCATEVYNETSELSQELERRMWIKIEDCALKSLENIDNIWDILVWLYANNPTQLSKDIKTRLFPLLELLSWDREKINKIIEFHKITPRFFFGADELLFWNVIEDNNDFPLEDFSYFIENHTDMDITSDEWRNFLMAAILRVSLRVNPNLFNLSYEEWERSNKAKPISNKLLSDMFRNFNNWWLINIDYPYNWEDALWKVEIVNKYKIWDSLSKMNRMGLNHTTRYMIEFLRYSGWTKNKILSCLEAMNTAPEGEIIKRLDFIGWPNILHEYQVSWICNGNIYKNLLDDDTFNMYTNLIKDIPEDLKKSYTHRFFRIKPWIESINLFHTSFTKEFINKDMINQKSDTSWFNSFSFQTLEPKTKIEEQLCNHPLIWHCHNVLMMFQEEKDSLEGLENRQKGLLRLLNAMEIEFKEKNWTLFTHNRDFEKRDPWDMISLRFRTIFWVNYYDADKIEDLISLVKQWSNLPPYTYGSFTRLQDRQWEKLMQNEDIEKRKEKDVKLYSHWLNKNQKEKYITLLSMLDLSEWKANQSFSLYQYSDNRNILDLFDIIKSIYEKTGQRISFSELDMIWEFKRNSKLYQNFIDIDFEELKESIESKLSTKRQTYRIPKYKYIYSEDISNIDKLSNIELFRLSLLLNILDSEKALKVALQNLNKDRKDLSTEYWWRVITRYPFFDKKAPAKKESDGSFAWKFNLGKYSKSISTFHQHALPDMDKIPMSYMAWPSSPDINTTNITQKTWVVLTLLSDNTFNVDYYTVWWVVVDLWNYSSK